MQLSRMQKLTLLFMAERYRKTSKERVTLASITSYQTQHYYRQVFDGNLRTSLMRLVSRGMLTQIPPGRSAKAPTFQLTETGLEQALKLLDEDDKNPPKPPLFFT